MQAREMAREDASGADYPQVLDTAMVADMLGMAYRQEPVSRCGNAH